MAPTVSMDGAASIASLTFDQLNAVINEVNNDEAQAHRRTSLDDMATSVNTFWLLYAGTVVFLMQAGFAMLEAGSLRSKNIKNILLKNILDPCVGALAFWAFGYGFAYGNSEGTIDLKLVGDTYFFLNGDYDSGGGGTYEGWFFQFAFAATAATIVSGAVAERCQFTAYALYSFFLTAWVYPVVVHAGWGGDGYFSAFADETKAMGGIGAIDFAGCGVVHMVGGLAAFLGAAVLGPRAGRFDPITGKIDDPMPGHNSALVVLGTFILWFGWYGFNPGSTLCISGCEFVAAKTAATTTLAAAAGGVTNVLIHKLLSGVISLEEACNGVLAGLVGITSACSTCELWAAVVIGAIGAVAYTGGAKLCLMLKIDDPCNASGVHFFAGMWGLIAPGLFASQTMVMKTYDGYPGGSGENFGLLYDGGGTLLGNQIAFLAFVVAWTTANMLPFFIVLKMAGLFRVTSDVEEAGMDASEHGGAGYNVK